MLAQLRLSGGCLRVKLRFGCARLWAPATGPMAGRPYFVRTAQLAPGKNALEVLVDGERLRRVVYSR